MLEEHEHESTCLDNIAAMRRETNEFVHQLLALFVSLDKPSFRIPQTPTAGAAADGAEGAGGAKGAGRGSCSDGSGKEMIEEKPGGVSRIGHHMQLLQPRHQDSNGDSSPERAPRVRPTPPPRVPRLSLSMIVGSTDRTDAGKDTVLEDASVGVAAGGGDRGEGQGGQGGGLIHGGDKTSLDQAGAMLTEGPTRGEVSGSVSSPPSVSSETGSESAQSSRRRLSDSHAERSPQTAREKARVPFGGVGCVRVWVWVCDERERDDRDSSYPLSLFLLPSDVATEGQNLTQTDCECGCVRVF